MSKALADMIESYKKLQITQLYCVSRSAHVARVYIWIYSIMHTLVTILWPVLCADNNTDRARVYVYMCVCVYVYVQRTAFKA